MTGDKYRTLTAAAVLIVAAVAAAVSYVHVVALAMRYGQPELAAYLLPVSVDGLVATSSLVMLRAARTGVTAPWLARAGLFLAVAATVACNVGYGLPHGVPGALLSGWPAVAFVVAAETAITMTRRKAPETVAVADDVPVGAPIPMPVEPTRAVAPVTAGPVADGASDGAAISQARATPRTVAQRRTRRHTPEQRAERAFAGRLEAGSLPSLRAIMRDIGVGQDKAREVRAHLASLATANGEVSNG